MKYFVALFIFSPVFAFGQLKVARVLTNNMVLQRDKPMHLWGWGIPGEKVSVSLSKITGESVVKKDSTWNVYLQKQKANANPQTLKIVSGEDQIILENVLIGDVWVCSGQSNMEWPLEKEMHFPGEINHTLQPLIRLLNPAPAGRFMYGVPYTDSLNSRLNKNDFYQWDSWQNCDSNASKSMSAVAYYFAKSIVSNQHIPVGIINLSIGGAPIETFISKDALQKYPSFAVKLNGDWLKNNTLPVWARERGTQNVGNNMSGFRDEQGLNHGYKPGFAFESGIEPLLPFPVTGITWYQGETNSLELERVNEYRDLLHLMIDDYRLKWKQPAMPFYWVQLSSIDTPGYKSQYWPIFRDKQRKLLKEIDYGGMAVCSDIGLKNNVHPTNKKDVGERLARWALNKHYGMNITPSGPLPVSAKYADGKVIISFAYAGKIVTSDGQPVRGFSLDGINEVPVITRKSQVVIKTNKRPQNVYYGWKPFTDANLCNGEMLPASTFKIRVAQ